MTLSYVEDGDSSVEPVLVEAAAFHDHGQVLALLLQDTQVLQRVAVDDQQVGVVVEHVV